MSIIKQKNQRVAIFIDAQNLYHSARSLYGSNVNFKNILEDTLSERELVRAIAYVITTESGEEKNFFEALKKAGIETKSKDLQIFLGGAKKGDWDVGMTVDAIRLASSVDAVIIVSGDGDFIPLVEYLKFNSGCQVEVATFRSTASAGLVEVVDDFFDLSDDLDRYLMKKYRKNFKGYKKNHFFNNQKNNSQNIKKDNFKNEGSLNKKELELEAETPEMISERVSGKRNIPKDKGKNNKVSKIMFEKNNESKSVGNKKKATEVQILRVKKAEMIIPKESQKVKSIKKKDTLIKIKKDTKKKEDIKDKKNKMVKKTIKKITKKIIKK